MREPRYKFGRVQHLASLRFLAVAGLALVLIPTPMKAEPMPLPESEASIEYNSVAGALTALRSKPGVVFTMEDGWLIATDEPAYSIWSFAPKNYPAYPAVVKRWVIPKQVGSDVRMDVLCEASKGACDELVRTFGKMNGLPLPQ